MRHRDHKPISDLYIMKPLKLNMLKVTSKSYFKEHAQSIAENVFETSTLTVQVL
jgi:hypothetical protein